MATPGLTIVTVTYNDVERLEKTLASVAVQDDQDFEFVVIDGASKDKTLERLQEFKSKRQLIVVSERDQGLYDAMNKGAREATGTFLLYLNAGDVMADDWATRRVLAEISQYPSVDAIYADVVVIDSTRGQRLKKAHSTDTLYKGLPSSHQALLLRRQHYLRFPFDCGLRLAADFHVALRAYNAGFREWRYTQPAFTMVTTGGVSDHRRLQARWECIKVLVRAGSPLQKVRGVSFHAAMIAVDGLTTLLRRLMGRHRYERLTAWRWN